MLPALVLAGMALHAPAQDVFTWNAPDGCPSAAAVVEDAEALSGLTLGDTLRVEATVQALEEGRWSLRLRIESPSGAQVRELEGRSCDELAGVAATLIAVALEAPVEPEPEVAPEPEPAPEVAPEPEPTRVEPPGWKAVFGPTVSLGLGALPGPAAVLSLFAGAERRWFRAEAAADIWLPRDGELSTTGAGGSMQLWTLAVRSCGVPSAGRLRFPVCGGVQVGQMRGQGQGISAPKRAALPWLAAEVTGGLRVDVHRNVALRADLGVFVPVLRPGFTLDGQGTVHRAAAVGGKLGAGLELRFP